MTDVQKSITFNEKHSLAIRIWHWTTFVVIAASLILVLLGSTMFKTKDNIPMVQEQLEGRGATVTEKQAWAVAHEYSDKLWMAHKYVGYGLCFLLLSRLVIEVTQSNEEKLKTKIRQAVSLSAGADRSHYLFVKRGYLIFYALFFVMGLTGLGLAYEHEPFIEPMVDGIKKVHETVQYAIYAYIVIHLVGVVRADAGKYPNVVSGMIHGGK